MLFAISVAPCLRTFTCLSCVWFAFQTLCLPAGTQLNAAFRFVFLFVSIFLVTPKAKEAAWWAVPAISAHTTLPNTARFSSSLEEKTFWSRCKFLWQHAPSPGRPASDQSCEPMHTTTCCSSGACALAQNSTCRRRFSNDENLTMSGNCNGIFLARCLRLDTRPVPGNHQPLR